MISKVQQNVTGTYNSYRLKRKFKVGTRLSKVLKKLIKWERNKYFMIGMHGLRRGCKQQSLRWTHIVLPKPSLLKHNVPFSHQWLQTERQGWNVNRLLSVLLLDSLLILRADGAILHLLVYHSHFSGLHCLHGVHQGGKQTWSFRADSRFGGLTNFHQFSFKVFPVLGGTISIISVLKGQWYSGDNGDCNKKNGSFKY